MANDRDAGAASVLVILGPLHSGAPVLARALAAAGATTAPDASRDATDFAVPRAIARLNAEMLESIGVGLANPGPLIAGGDTLAAVRADVIARLIAIHRQRAVTLLRAATGAPTTLLSDPQMALLLPFWRAVLAEAGIDARFVVVHRNPVALADLARQRTKQPIRRGWFIWQYLMLDMLEAVPEATVVKASDLTCDPDAVARALLPAAGPATSGAPSPTLDEHPRDADAFDAVPLFAAQGRALHALLEDWADLPVPERSARLADLRARFDDAMLVGAMGRPPKAIAATPEASEPLDPATPMRPLILHYHLFKNAGSSVDAMLRKNFGDRWTEHEFPKKGRDNTRAAVTAFLEDHAAIDAFSSHTMLLPTPRISGRSIIPIIFVRHPLLRLRSAYGFERRQDADTSGAKLAKQTDFAGYIAALLKEPRNRQVRNFQTVRFAFGTPGEPGREFERAMTTLAGLPFVGLVEQYDSSIARLCKLVQPAFPDFEPLIVRRNADQPQDTRTIDERVAQVHGELGATLFDELVAANHDDIRLFEHVLTLYPGETD